MTSTITLNNCQRVCVQVNGTNAAAPYSWVASNSNVAVTSGGNNLAGIFTAVSPGGCNVYLRDANGAVMATFIVQVTSITTYVPPSTSNTVYLGSKIFTSTSNSSTATFNGNFSTLSAGLGANNFIWFAFNNGTTATCNQRQINNSTWDRSSSAMSFNYASCVGNQLTLFVAGVGITSSSPLDNALDYQVPVVNYVPLTNQSLKFSGVGTLPYPIPCSDLSNYLIFAQSGLQAGTGPITSASIQSSLSVKVGYTALLSAYSFSYMIVAKGITVGSGPGVIYSDLLTSQTFTTTNTPITTSLKNTVSNALWFALVQSNSISDSVVTNAAIITSVSQSGNTLTIVYTNGSGSNIVADIAIFAINNQNTATITSVTF